MGRIFDELDSTLTQWIADQPVFFVGTAPAGPDGHINISPKGARNTFKVLAPTRVAWLDLVGSGVETIAHLRENGRIVVMFCAFSGPPKVIRLHGQGRVIQQGDAEFAQALAWFDPTPDLLGIARSVIVVEITRIADSCGFVVPRMDLVEERDQLIKWGAGQERRWGNGWKDEYVMANNLQSIDGLPGLNPLDDNTSLSTEDLQRRSSDGKAL